MKIGIVTAEFNSFITFKMEEAAKKYAQENNCSVTHAIRVPGSYDMPFAIQLLLKKQDVDAVVVLGAIIQGETKHDEVIGYALGKTIHELTIQYEKPIGFGVLGPGINAQQAEKRAEDYAQRAVNAAISLFKLK
ncbi:6,7-dimethyl-8-ribityllumazine synthase [Candidatus Micrarchaeota archaeon]|nr:6,7-dimethyl-8-ribityllumazine synthase [Candidatus Micrarchaeota archaeon]